MADLPTVTLAGDTVLACSNSIALDACGNDFFFDLLLILRGEGLRLIYCKDLPFSSRRPS